MMKKFLFSLAVISTVSLTNAQTVIFEDNFDAYEDFAIDGVGDWTLVDVDASPLYGFTGITFPNSGGPFAYIVFNSTMTDPILEPSDTSDWSAYSGEKCMVSFAAVPPAGGGTGPNNDWLISPAITLGGGDNELSFMYKSCDATYGFEEFNVLISTTDTNPDSFVAVEEFLSTDNPLVWTEFTASLDDWAGETVYIAIQCTSNDQFGFAVDDFKVTGETLGVSDLNANVSSVYPNPVVDSFQVNLSSKFNANQVSVTVTDLSGKTVKTFGNQTSYNVSELPKGVYIVKITDGKNVETKKLIKK